METKPNYLTLISPLDDSVKRDHKFHIRSLQGEEGICRDFAYRLTVCCPEKIEEEKLEKLIGKSCTISIAYLNKLQKVNYRFINGLVYQVTELGVSVEPVGQKMWHYELELGSWLRQLQMVNDCRIFQKNGNTSLSIIKEIFEDLDLRDFESKSVNKLPRRDYCVCFSESLFDFFNRLCQEDGIVWDFRHTDKRHFLVLSQDTTNRPEISEKDWGVGDHLLQFRKQGNHIPLKDCLISSYDWENPPVKNVLKPVSRETGKYTGYTYDARFIKRDQGDQKAARMVQAWKNKIRQYHGESNIRAFQSCHRLRLESSRLEDLNNKPYLITHLRTEATQSSFLNHFEAIPAKQPFYLLEEKISKPRIVGPQTAIVVGEGGKGEVAVDKLGRVKVRFHYDHYSPADSSRTSAYLRVSGPAAGNNRGIVFTPRIGEEVVVIYINNDPDLPMISGSVYSPANPPPIKPSNRPYTSMIKTDADKKSNSIIFEDKPGSEDFKWNAKKDMEIEVGGDMTIDVVEHMRINAKSITINVEEDVTVDAGGNIVNMSVATINSLAGAAISNTALGGIINLAGGLINNVAGGMITNTAILSVANTSAMGIKQDAKTVIANTAAGAVLNTATKVANVGDLVVANTSNLAIVNSATGDICNDALLQKNKIGVASDTEADSYSIKGVTKIN